jgi:hypothetical protein
MPKDKNGNYLTWAEFMARWKSGMESVTPLQQTRIGMLGYIAIFAGILWGIVVTAMINQWWLFTILIGSLVVSGVQFFGTMQKYLILTKLEKELHDDEKIDSS